MRTGYAIVRYDGSLASSAEGRAELLIKVVKVIFDEDEAFREVERLNSLRRTTATHYFVSATRIHDE